MAKMAHKQSCPLCAAPTGSQRLFSNHVYQGRPGQKVFRCNVCDLTYLFPILSTKEKGGFYRDEFPNFMASRASNSREDGWLESSEHIQQNEPQRKRRMKYLEPHLPKPGGRILDIGCSSGFMLFPLAERGYDCTGIEPTTDFADFMNSRDITCFESQADLMKSLQAEQGFDLIMHFFVADQTSDTFKFIEEQIPLLREGGTIIFEINSTNDPMISLYKLESFDRFCWAVAQNYFYSSKSFKYLMEKFTLEYEIILDQRYDLSNHMVWARDGKPGGIGRFTDVLGEEIEEQYKQALIKAGHCDTLIGILKKPQLFASKTPS
jgi:SAM-dependent methyltransferase